MRRTALFLAAALSPATGVAQTSPFVREDVFRHLVNEISGDRAAEDVRRLGHFHRTDGSVDFFRAAESIERAARDAGLEDVKLVRQAWSGHGWSCSFGEAWLVSPEEKKLASYSSVAVSIADHSRTTHVTAAIVDVGTGTVEADYEGKDVRGKIVLADGAVAKVQELAVWRRGALGILSDASSRDDPMDAPDQVAWGRLPFDARDVEGVPDGTPSTFAVMISPRRGRALRARLSAGGDPLQVRVDIESTYPPLSEQAYVEGWIHGEEIHDQQIVLTAHIQEEMPSANDDGSGCASMLEIARALTRLIGERKLPRPRRDIHFWWTNEIESEQQYFRENPAERRRMLVAINQDMVGARQSLGGRVQYASRSPWSLPSILDDVMESVLGMVRDGNTDLLTLRHTSSPKPFSREILAATGSREPFHARMVPYYAQSDHHVFTSAAVGVPATALINWPDGFIHSSGDDISVFDATQLQRNAVVVAAVGLFFAYADETDAATLAAYAAAQGRARAAADVARAVAHLTRADPSRRDHAYREARNLVHHAHVKEQRAVASVRRLATKGRAADIASRASSRLEEAERDGLELIEQDYVALAGKNPPNPELSPEERKMAEQVFTPTSDIGAYIDGVKKAGYAEGLHRVMQFEAYNLADGSRSALEVFETVQAEALSAGEWYYGTVTPSAVLDALTRGVAAGAFSLGEPR